jgi:beta-galactosidase/beta-glucuronidase
LRINGEPVLLRGACVHHDNGLLGAATIDRAEERRVEFLKEAGFNAIRSAHNPLEQADARACDRLGMLVMDETFDMWTQPKSEHDYASALPRLVGGGCGSHGPQGLQPPERDPLQHRQRDPRGGDADGRARRPRIWRRRSGRSTPPGSSRKAVSGLLVGGA